MPWWTWVITIAVGITLGLLLNNRKPTNKDAIHIVNEKDFKDNMRKGQLVDVRKKEDYEQGHIKGARNFQKRHLIGKYSKLRRDQSVFLYCNDGKQSFKIARQMSKDDFRNIYVLDGGFNK